MGNFGGFGEVLEWIRDFGRDVGVNCGIGVAAFPGIASETRLRGLLGCSFKLAVG